VALADGSFATKNRKDLADGKLNHMTPHSRITVKRSCWRCHSSTSTHLCHAHHREQTW